MCALNWQNTSTELRSRRPATRMSPRELGILLGVAVSMVPGARIELATPAFSGRRSTNELPRHFGSFSILGALASSVNSAQAPGQSAAHASFGFTRVNVDTRRRLQEACQSLLEFTPLIRIGHQHNVERPVLKRNSLKSTLVRILYSEDLLPVGAVAEEGPNSKCCAPIQIVWGDPRHSPMPTGLQ